jgi:hypothetical protein
MRDTRAQAIRISATGRRTGGTKKGGAFAVQDMDVFLRVAAELGDEILGPPGTLSD